MQAQDASQAGWLRLAAAARVAGVSRATLDRIATSGRVPYAVVGVERFFSPDDLIALKASRRADEPEQHDEHRCQHETPEVAQ
jgi:hypothetical protein